MAVGFEALACPSQPCGAAKSKEALRAWLETAQLQQREYLRKAALAQVDELFLSLHASWPYRYKGVGLLEEEVR